MKNLKLNTSLRLILLAFALNLSVSAYSYAEGLKGKGLVAGREKQSIFSLDQAIAEGLKNNPALQAADAEKAVAQARIHSSGALENPMLEAKLNNYPVSSLSAREYGMTGNEVMLVQKFPYPGKRERMEHIAGSEHESAVNQLEKSRLELVRDVKLAYYDLFLADKKEQLINEQLKLLSRMQASSSNKYSLGLTTQSEILELQLKSAALLIRLEEEKRNAAVKRAELDSLIGRTEPSPDWKPEEIRQTEVSPLTINSKFSAETVLGNNPEVQSLIAQNKAANINVELAELNSYPDFSVGVGYMQRFDNADDSGEDFVSARVSIDLPFFQRSRTESLQAEARARRDKAEALLSQSKLELSRQIQQNLAELSEAANKINLYKQALLPLTDGAIASAEKGYETDQVPYSAVLSLINSRLEAKTEYYAALLAHEAAIAKLETLTINPVFNLKK